MEHLEAGKPRRTGGLEWARRGDAGFSLLELLLICLLAGTVMTVAVFKLGTSVNAAKARGAIAQVKLQMSTAREMAISQQRDIRIEFNAPDQIRIVRINRPAAAGETVLADVRLEGGMTFQKFPGTPETPDPWGGDTAVAFGAATSLRFRSSDGMLVDQNGATLNGRVFVGRAGANGDIHSAGVVSIFGPTGRLRSYRLVGTTWEY